jgi:hypothetical protein
MLTWGAACTGAPWARGPRVTPLASGVVGEWLAASTSGSRDTTLLRFTAEGSAEEVRIQPTHGVTRTPFGPFRVYADSGRYELLCFSFRRGRALPACRYFQVDTLSDAVGARRELRLLQWVGESRREPEIWTERRPR